MLFDVLLGAARPCCPWYVSQCLVIHALLDGDVQVRIVREVTPPAQVYATRPYASVHPPRSSAVVYSPPGCVPATTRLLPVIARRKDLEEPPQRRPLQLIMYRPQCVLLVQAHRPLELFATVVSARPPIRFGAASIACTAPRLFATPPLLCSRRRDGESGAREERVGDICGVQRIAVEDDTALREHNLLDHPAERDVRQGKLLCVRDGAASDVYMACPNQYKDPCPRYRCGAYRNGSLRTKLRGHLFRARASLPTQSRLLPLKADLPIPGFRDGASTASRDSDASSLRKRRACWDFREEREPRCWTSSRSPSKRSCVCAGPEGWACGRD